MCLLHTPKRGQIGKYPLLCNRNRCLPEFLCSTMIILIDNGHGSGTPGITRSELLAADLYEAARKHLAGQRIRQYNGPEELDFESNFLYFATANALQYSQKIYTRIAAPTWPSFKAAQGRGLSLCST